MAAKRPNDGADGGWEELAAAIQHDAYKSPRRGPGHAGSAMEDEEYKSPAGRVHDHAGSAIRQVLQNSDLLALIAGNGDMATAGPLGSVSRYAATSARTSRLRLVHECDEWVTVCAAECALLRASVADSRRYPTDPEAPPPVAMALPPLPHPYATQEYFARLRGTNGATWRRMRALQKADERVDVHWTLIPAVEGMVAQLAEPGEDYDTGLARLILFERTSRLPVTEPEQVMSDIIALKVSRRICFDGPIGPQTVIGADQAAAAARAFYRVLVVPSLPHNADIVETAVSGPDADAPPRGYMWRGHYLRPFMISFLPGQRLDPLAPQLLRLDMVVARLRRSTWDDI